MKQVLSLCLLGVLCSTLNAQVNYVEVSVNDTVQLKADYFILRVSSSGEMDYNYNPDTTGMRTDPNYYRKAADRQRQKQMDALKAIEGKLKDAGFALEPLLLSDFAYRNSMVVNLSISTHSVTALAALNELIKTEKGLTCNLTQVSSSQEDAVSTKLIQKLMARAKVKANELARQAGKKILAIISVSDKRSDVPVYALNNMMLLNSLGIDRQNSPGEKSINTNYPLQGSLTVKFAWQ